VPTDVARGSRSGDVRLFTVVGGIVLAVLIGGWLVRRRLR
jgi:hypothetical protein